MQISKKDRERYPGFDQLPLFEKLRYALLDAIAAAPEYERGRLADFINEYNSQTWQTGVPPTYKPVFTSVGDDLSSLLSTIQVGTLGSV